MIASPPSPSTTTTTRINLWSSPRNISTALMYSFAQRPDTAVVDEPLYAHYLTHQPTRAHHPLREEILAEIENDGERVVHHLTTRDYGRPAVVFKQMTHHLVKLETDWLLGMRNVLLIRDPRYILRSFGKVIEEVTAADVGIPQQLELARRLRAANALDAVVDARRLLLDPAGVLRRLCERLDLPFEEAMLRWPAGPRPEDGVWAPHWYASVHRSTGFAPYRERTFTLRPELRRVAEECRGAYAELLTLAI